MKNIFQHLEGKRLIIMVIGNVIMGLGIAFFKLSLMGNDPFNGMNMALANVTGISYPVMQILVNLLFLVLEFLFGRKYLGAGTVFNAFILGYIVTFFIWLFGGLFGSSLSIFVRVILVLTGTILAGLGLSLYQQSDVGVSPYDSMAIILDERIPKLPYFWCRMICDGSCALVVILAGGIVGLGTIVTVFGMGPVVHFFDRTLTEKYIIKKKQRA